MDTNFILFLEFLDFCGKLLNLGPQFGLILLTFHPNGFQLVTESLDLLVFGSQLLFEAEALLLQGAVSFVDGKLQALHFFLFLAALSGDIILLFEHILNALCELLLQIFLSL